jgi:flagellar motor switch protein FliN
MTTLQMLQLAEMHRRDEDPRDVAVLDDLNPLHHVKARIQVRVGEATLSVGELLAAKEGRVIVLDRLVDQPVDLVLEGRVIARGQLVAVDESFAVRITELPVALRV